MSVFCLFYAGYLIQIHFEVFSAGIGALKNNATFIVGVVAWGILFVIWYLCDAVFVPRLCVSVVGIFACVSFAMKLCNTKLGVVLSALGKYSLQLYLLNGYLLVVSRTVLVQVLGVTDPVVIVAGNLVFDLVGAFLLTKYVLEKSRLLRILCGEIH